MRFSIIPLFLITALLYGGEKSELSESERSALQFSLRPEVISGETLDLTALMGYDKLITNEKEISVILKNWKIQRIKDDKKRFFFEFEIKKPQHRKLNLYVRLPGEKESLGWKWMDEETEVETFIFSFEIGESKSFLYFGGWIGIGGKSPSGLSVSGCVIDFFPRSQSLSKVNDYAIESGPRD
jgi:hypothetical protein